MLTYRKYVRASAKKERDIKHIESNTVIVQRHSLKFVSVQHNLIEYNFIQFSYNLIKNNLFDLINFTHHIIFFLFNILIHNDTIKYIPSFSTLTQL